MTEKNRPMTTDHLIIRQSCWDDLEDFYRWERMPEVTESRDPSLADTVRIFPHKMKGEGHYEHHRCKSKTCSKRR